MQLKLIGNGFGQEWNQQEWKSKEVTIFSFLIRELLSRWTKSTQRERIQTLQGWGKDD